MNKHWSTHNAHDCMRERVGLKAQTTVLPLNTLRMREAGAELRVSTWLEKELAILSLQNEGRPVIRRMPAFIIEHLFLCRSQSGRGGQFFYQHFPVKDRHQFRRRTILDRPQTDHN